MPSATKHAGLGQGRGDNLLKGSDLPPKTQKITVVCIDVRISPDGFRSPFIMEIEPQFGKGEWALNRSNTQALVTLIDDDYEKWAGWQIEISKHMTNNPRTKQQAWGLVVTGAEKLKRKVKSGAISEETKPQKF